jgi:hypothetical protein
VERAERRHAEAALAAAAAAAPGVAPDAPAAAPALPAPAAVPSGEGDFRSGAAAAEGESAGEGAAAVDEAAVEGETGDMLLDDGMVVGKVGIEKLRPSDFMKLAHSAPESVLAEATALMEICSQLPKSGSGNQFWKMEIGFFAYFPRKGMCFNSSRV